MKTNVFDFLLTSKKAVMPYFTFGDPSVEVSEKIIEKAILAGADAIEIGIPFSDPIADGPVIQASHQRALAKNSNLNIKDALQMVKRLKSKHSTPLVFMVAVNLIYQYGVESFFKDALFNGLDGVIVPDLLFEESDEFETFSKKYNIHLIRLVSFLCEENRLKKIAKKSSGFIYLITTTGTTGVRDSFSNKLHVCVDLLKKVASVPVVLGFGISTKEQVDWVCSISDGAIIGSYFVNKLAEYAKKGDVVIDEIVNDIQKFKV